MKEPKKINSWIYRRREYLMRAIVKSVIKSRKRISQKPLGKHSIKCLKNVTNHMYVLMSAIARLSHLGI